MHGSLYFLLSWGGGGLLGVPEGRAKSVRGTSPGIASLCKSESWLPSSVADLVVTVMRACLGNALVFSHLAAS